MSSHPPPAPQASTAGKYADDDDWKRSLKVPTKDTRFQTEDVTNVKGKFVCGSCTCVVVAHRF
jgi:hypothetical protein